MPRATLVSRHVAHYARDHPFDTPHAPSGRVPGGPRPSARADHSREIALDFAAMQQRIRFCTAADGVRVAYATAGRGAPLVRSGGWLTHVERDWDSPVWRHWLQALTARHSLARFDIRGSGLSDRNVSEMSLDVWVRDLEAVVDALGWERFPLLGLCQGGAIALAYAARHPERVTRIVLYNSSSTARTRAVSPARWSSRRSCSAA